MEYDKSCLGQIDVRVAESLPRTWDRWLGALTTGLLPGSDAPQTPWQILPKTSLIVAMSPSARNSLDRNFFMESMPVATLLGTHARTIEAPRWAYRALLAVVSLTSTPLLSGCGTTSCSRCVYAVGCPLGNPSLPSLAMARMYLVTAPSGKYVTQRMLRAVRDRSGQTLGTSAYASFGSEFTMNDAHPQLTGDYYDLLTDAPTPVIPQTIWRLDDQDRPSKIL